MIVAVGSGGSRSDCVKSSRLYDDPDPRADACKSEELDNTPEYSESTVHEQHMDSGDVAIIHALSKNPEGLPLALQGVALQVCAAINSQNTISELCRAKLFLCDDGLVRPQDGAREEQKMEEMNIDSGHALSDATRKFYITAITTEFQFWIQNYTRGFC
jgi:hypothetical protein